MGWFSNVLSHSSKKVQKKFALQYSFAAQTAELIKSKAVLEKELMRLLTEGY